MTVHFTVPGKPMGKQRPRFNGKTKSTYTPEETLNYENLIKWTYQSQAGGQKLNGAIKACIVACYPIPTAASKKRREAMLQGTELPTKKPDTDNIAKIVLDSLNGIAFYDDSQVVALMVSKIYAENPRVEVRLEEI